MYPDSHEMFSLGRPTNKYFLLKKLQINDVLLSD